MNITGKSPGWYWHRVTAFIVPAEPDSKGRGGSGDDVDAFIRQQMKKQGISFDE